jgi:hypothetical protein
VRLSTWRLITVRLSTLVRALRNTASGSADEETGGTSGAVRRPGHRSGSRRSAGSRRARGGTGGVGAALRGTGVVTRASAAAGLLVAVVTAAAYLTDSGGSGAASMAGAINSLESSDAVRALVKQHQLILELDSASQVLTRAAKPATADAATLLAQSATASTGGTGIVGAPPPANPTAAEALGRELEAAAGFGTAADWSCLYNLWNRESGWNVYAENPSGAYGIPQAYPGSKMAEFGADWQTDAATQIKWGLSYIEGIYGTPCNAWNHELATGYY